MSFHDRQPIEQGIPFDEYGTTHAVSEGYGVFENTPSELSAGIDEYDDCRRMMTILDSDENINRLAITGKVSIQVEPPPSGGVGIAYYADDPLSIKKQHTTEFVLPVGKTLFIQQIILGCQGDPSKNGSKAEISFDDGTSHLIDRLYVNGATMFGNHISTNEARDGTPITGNGTNKLVILRDRLAVSEQEIDVIIRGYHI